MKTHPNDPDSDNDGASDGIERELFGDPRDDKDAGCFGDTDRDGLVNLEETQGWQVRVQAVSTEALQPMGETRCDIVCKRGEETTPTVFPDPNIADTDGDRLFDAEEQQLETNPEAADTDGDGISDFDEVRGFLMRDKGVINTDPNDADTDDDKLSDGAEAGRPAPAEKDKWIVRPVGKPAYQVFSDPLIADGDFDRLADGDERAAGSDPGNSNTDEDARDDYAEFRDGTNPLVNDFRVTVGYGSLWIAEDCDSPGQVAGNFEFDFGVQRPDGSVATAVSSKLLLPSPHPQTLYLDSCNGDIEKNLCRVNNTQIQLEHGTRLSLGNKVTTFGATVFDEFTLSGDICDMDGTSCDDRSTFVLDDPFPNLEMNGSDRSGFFAAADLSNGTITGKFTKPVAVPEHPRCGPFELTVFITVSGKQE